MGKLKIVKKTEKELIADSKKEEGVAAPKAVSQKASSKIENGRVYIQASYNNTIVSATDQNGNVLAWLSAGSVGFSGPKKSTPFAASRVAEAVAEKVKRFGLLNIRVFVKGAGKGRDSAIRSLAAKGFNILSVKDMTPVPHNGPRPPKVRRI